MKTTREQIDDVLQPLVMTDDLIKKLMAAYLEQMELASSPDEKVRKTSDHLMGNTYIRELLDGTEQGDYLGLDLGGTNFRVVLVRFKDGTADKSISNCLIPDDLLKGPCAFVFDFIAEKIKAFLEGQGLASSKKKIPLGFTFSFPSVQLAINKSYLVTWTKTFRCPDGVGDDPVKLLEDAIERKAKGIPVDVVAICSDTVATLMAGNYLDKNCRIGLILGTGCNAAFVESIKDIRKWTGDDKEPKHVIVNVECGSTGDNGCLDFCRNEYEKDMDNRSNHPHSFTFEKSIAGLYLGELVRLVLVHLIEQGLLFGGNAQALVDGAWKFTTSFVTDIERNDDGCASRTKQILLDFGVEAVSDGDVEIVREVCTVISKRAASIIAGAMSVLVNHIGLPEVTIGVDGSLYQHHPHLAQYMYAVFEKHCPYSKVTMILAKDGSCHGAAFAAVSAQRQAVKGLRCS